MVKPGRKKKPFIGKHEEQVTFHLVHRSQRDPLAADETAPQRVLHVASVGGQETSKQKEEQRKYGIFFDDDYNYLQHLRDVQPLEQVELTTEPVVRKPQAADGEVPLLLPSSVFASNVEEGVGLLNKAAPVSGPRVDWDPDVVAALDDDFDFDDPDNCLEDDFIVKANAPGANPEEPYDGDDDESVGGFLSDGGSNGGRLSPIDEFDFEDEETGSRFTSYSLSSSVIRRNAGLKTLDNRFETLYEQYDESEIGALDTEEIAGAVTMESERFKQILEDYEIKKQQDRNNELNTHDLSIRNLDVSDDDDELVKIVVEEPKEKWDCESIISTYSNLYNHPKLITEPPKKPTAIRVPNTVGFPVDEVKSNLTQRNLRLLSKDSERQDPDARSVASCSAPARRKGETREEKLERKRTVKEQRKERRLEKKANTLAFKEEKKRQEKVVLNLQQNMRSIKLS